jgi:hypothetical protein
VQSRRIHEETGQQTFVLVFETGDEAMEGLGRFARDQGLSAAHFTGIGAFSDVVLGYFDWQQKDYQPIRLNEQVEVSVTSRSKTASRPCTRTSSLVARTVRQAAATCSRDTCARRSRSFSRSRRRTYASTTTKRPASL